MGIRVSTLEEIYPLADFIADAIGTSAEVVVHDVSDLDVSVVYIRNGNLSGRKIGDGATDRALKLIQEQRHSRAHHVSNYSGINLAGRQFRCSTCFIEDMTGALIGLLCVNIDITGLEAVSDVLERLLSLTNPSETVQAPSESNSTNKAALSQADLSATERDRVSDSRATEMLVGSPEETVRKITRLVMSGYPVEATRLSRAERLAALAQINDEGAFYMKGAVGIVAEEMGISVPTVYKYLQEVRSDSR